ncbi:MAG: hypothetical protein IJE03_03415, partial [Ruminiclostridium sp.]|nr:hypothetical protein [Ruminiclostridium sp.]
MTFIAQQLHAQSALHVPIGTLHSQKARFVFRTKRAFCVARQKGLEPPTLRTGIVHELTLVL